MRVYLVNHGKHADAHADRRNNSRSSSQESLCFVPGDGCIDFALFAMMVLQKAKAKVPTIQNT